MLNKTKKQTMSEKIKNFLTICKIRKEAIYKGKIEFLENECYKFYLEKILDERYKAKVVDFPRFMYEQRLTICSEAIRLSKEAVAKAELLWGRKHIEKCYKKQLQVVNQNLKNKK